MKPLHIAMLLLAITIPTVRLIVVLYFFVVINFDKNKNS